ncbi:MAG: DUF1549 domain-containing protein [Verrucomicrobiales bacterium]|nr:DUF1549 domain-containing protein [Verrucomicrobiae bacterium]MCP5554059.1 DUF1549 domain-containing protein [Akkermansiaceae bacterium]
MTLRHCGFLFIGVFGLIDQGAPAGYAGMTDPDRAAAEMDALLEKGWAREGLQGNPVAGDAVFVRRVYLDIVGRIPTAREALEFAESTDPEKRPRLIDRMLAGDGYALSAYNYWADVLRLQQFGAIGSTAGAAYVLWLKDSLRSNKPYDQMVRELITAKGLPWENGAIGYYMRDQRMPLDNFANTCRIFLGTRIECAQCHNHPFDKWTQMDFYHMAAFTYGKESKGYQSPAWKGAQELAGELNREVNRRYPVEKLDGPPERSAEGEAEKLRVKFINQSVNDIGVLAMGGVGVYNQHQERVLQLPHDYQYEDAKPFDAVAPKTLFGREAVVRPGESPDVAYARWMTSPDNPRFTRVIANRLWKMAFGLALIEPLDDLNDQSAAANPELMDRLERLVKDSGYDLKVCLAAIYRTRAYQAESSRDEVPPGETYAFTGPILRRLSAEQIWDSIVTLISPTPDLPNPYTEGNLRTVISRSGKVIAALDGLTPREAYQGAVAAAEAYQAAAGFATEARAEIEKLRAKKEDAAADELYQKVMQAQGGGRQELGKTVFLPAVIRLDAKRENLPAPPWPHSDQAPPKITREALLVKKPADPLMAVYELKVRGFDKSSLTQEQQQAKEESGERALLAEAAYFGIPEANRKAYVTGRRSQMQYWKRASDEISPAFRGHYLRIFGQSDRQLIENSSRDASIPQTLTLMNSDLLASVLNASSHLQLTIHRETDPDRRLEAVYLSLLARKPSDHEREVWRRAQADGLDSLDDLIYALINTRRFLFNP